MPGVGAKTGGRRRRMSLISTARKKFRVCAESVHNRGPDLCTFSVKESDGG